MRRFLIAVSLLFVITNIPACAVDGRQSESSENYSLLYGSELEGSHEGLIEEDERGALQQASSCNCEYFCFPALRKCTWQACNKTGSKYGRCEWFWENSLDIFLPVDFDRGSGTNPFADAVNLWLEAYILAGSKGGGPPDPDLVARAEALPISPEGHTAVFELVTHVLAVYVGDADLQPSPGYFHLPALCDADQSNRTYEERVGRMLAFNSTLLGISEIVKEGVVGELQSPRQGKLESALLRIPVEFPDYEPLGGCQYPHPDAHGHVFPYNNGVVCVMEMLRGGLEVYLPPPTKDQMARGR